MGASAVAASDRPTLTIRGTPYPVLLPTLRDPRLHLASVIVSLQVLGQVAFDFDLSIAQILIALGASAVLEFAIAFRRRRVIMWPASALLTGNGVAFVLRVPGTEHGDWWSTRGWWIFAGTAAAGLLSKHLIRFRGQHLFNPSNFGLVLCFLALGKDRADPLDFWWAPMSPWMATALAIIVCGGLLILSRIGLLDVAVGFWVAFAAGIGVLALTDHAMTARWHLGEITGDFFWRALVFSPEVLVFLFFMLTDPRTIPAGRTARRVYSVGVGVLAVLLIAPQRTEFASKVALLGALAIGTAARPLLDWALAPERAARVLRLGRRGGAAAAVCGAACLAGIVVAAGLPARSSATAAVAPPLQTGRTPAVTVLPSRGVATQLDRATALTIARSAVADLELETAALRLRRPARAAAGVDESRLAELTRRVRAAAGKPIDVPAYRVEHMAVHLEPGVGQGPPTIVAALRGRLQVTTYSLAPADRPLRHEATPFRQTLHLVLDGSRYRITGAPAALPPQTATVAEPTPAVRADFAGVHLKDVAAQVGLDFRQGSFRFGVTGDTQAMMGGGVCWLDYDGDGWLDLFAVNSYTEADVPSWQEHGGLPRSALFHNVHGRFVDVSARSHADLDIRGNGCVAADLDGDGRTDLYVTGTAGDALLWNDGDGTFTEGARAAGIVSFGWRTGAAVADVNGDGRPDLFVAGYTDPNAPVPSSAAGFPTNHAGVRDLLFVNEGPGPNGHARFREVGRQVGLDRRVEHGLGAVFTDVDSDGRIDLYVANDEDPNRLYLNRPAAAAPGFRLVEEAARAGVADANAGMGVASADYSGDGRDDLFVSNSRDQTHAVYRADAAPGRFADTRAAFKAAFGRNFTGWGASWVDLNRDGKLDLALANGAIPVTNLAANAGPLQVLDNLSGKGTTAFGDATALLGLAKSPRVNGRGLAAADFDNDGDVDIAVNTIGGPLLLLRNTSTAGHWLEVALPGVQPGARVTAVLPGGRRLVREVHAGSSYLSSEDPRLHFGLGAATTVERLLVRYPDGRAAELREVAADRLVNAPR
jgi:Na+-translocating ferredoxin:NAD+ oxidoreductase RnfD subunit